MVESGGPRQPAAGGRPRGRPHPPVSGGTTNPFARRRMGQTQEAEQPRLLAAAEGLRDLRRRPDAAEVPDGAHAAALHRVPHQERLRHRRHGGHGHDVPRRLRHPRLRRRLHPLLLRRQEPEAPQRRHHPRLLREVLLPGHPARRAHRLHAADLEPAHGRRAATRSTSTSASRRSSSPTSATCRSRCLRLEHRPWTFTSFTIARVLIQVPMAVVFLAVVPLGPGRLPGRQPGHGDPAQPRRACRSTSRGSASSGTGR